MSKESQFTLLHTAHAFPPVLFRFDSLTKHFTDSIGSQRDRIICPLTTTTRSQKYIARCVVDSRTFFEKGYTMQNHYRLLLLLLLLFLFLMGFSYATLKNTFYKNIIMKSWRGWCAQLYHLAGCMLHVINTAHFVAVHNVHVYFTTGPFFSLWHWTRQMIRTFPIKTVTCSSNSSSSSTSSILENHIFNGFIFGYECGVPYTMYVSHT